MISASIIIPNYNHATFLKQRIESVLNQTFQDFGIIILDDCSTDNSKEIIEQYRSHPKVNQIVYNEKNSGSTFKQWEKGLGLATGEYIWIAESDDWADISFLQKAMNIFSKYPTVGIFHCGSNWVNEEGEILFSDSLNIDRDFIKGKDCIRENLTNGNNLYNASSIVFRKSIVSVPLDKFILSFKYCGDWIFWIKLLEKSDYFYLNENLNYFRKDPLGTSSFAHINGLFFTEGIRIYGYLKKAGLKNTAMFDKEDRYWAFRFIQRKYSSKIFFQFFRNSFSAGILLPLYVIWFYIKLNVLKIKSS
jgi:glycosyltransferase involved in cell wall biosynthesis